MIQKIVGVSDENDDDDSNLEKFFNVFIHLNGYKSFDKKFIENIREFLKFKWENDQTNFMNLEIS